MKSNSTSELSRRRFIRGCAATAALSGMDGFIRPAAGQISALGARELLLDRTWEFAGPSHLGAVAAPSPRVCLPHTVVPLSWKNWDPGSWEKTWTYRRHFSVPPDWRAWRLFLHFERVMAGITPVVNGHTLPGHLGGFLPFDREITGLVEGDRNVLELTVDARWLNVPPAGSPKGAPAVDYLLPGGITGSISLRAFPSIYLREIFARPVDVLGSGRRMEIMCRTDAALALPADAQFRVRLRRGEEVVASLTHSQKIEHPDQESRFTMGDLKDVQLWSPDHPHLYSLEVTLWMQGQPVHRVVTKTGFRDARFETDGFFLNGQRMRIFGLNRHELYPYLGFAAPSRLLRRDAEILRNKFNCNMVRCSHYPQSEAFLDACDELGLMVWEEPPGWQYIGDEHWQELAIGDVEEMIRRDRNHPSIIIWGVRINESRNDPELYAKTRALAQSLDDSRQTSGTMTPSSRRDWQTEWHQDVFAFDDYHADRAGSVGIEPPVRGFPYLITETVGQFNYVTGRKFDLIYRRGGDPEMQAKQALFHAEAHNKAASYPRCAGVIAWCAFEYASLMNSWHTVKCPGVGDFFRIPKLGAAFYLAQVDPAVRPVIEPGFYWDFGEATPAGPGARAAIFSNCERLELFIDGKQWAALRPDREGFANLRYPPFFADFSGIKPDGSHHPELRVDGYVGEKRLLSRSFSSDRSRDRLWLAADDPELEGDGSDATKLAFAAVDRFGALRSFVEGNVLLRLQGPGEIVGDNPFSLTESGGAGAVWIRAAAGGSGLIQVEARHATLGAQSVAIRVKAAD
jgi:beta-galactosidase